MVQAFVSHGHCSANIVLIVDGMRKKKHYEYKCPTTLI